MDTPLFSEAVEEALKNIISELDYDLHKGIETPEDGTEDGYPALAEQFIRVHWQWAKSLELM